MDIEFKLPNWIWERRQALFEIRKFKGECYFIIVSGIVFSKF